MKSKGFISAVLTLGFLATTPSSAYAASSDPTGGPLLLGGELVVFQMDADDHNQPAAGQTRDVSGNGLHGSLNGGVASVGGRYGNGYDFVGGGGGHINIPEDSRFSGGTSMTWTFWFKADAIKGVFLQKANGGSWAMDLQISSKKLIVRVGSGLSETTTVFSPGAWYHVAVAYDGAAGANADRLKTYINGVQDTGPVGSTVPPSIPINGAQPRIGKWDDASGYFDGILDEVRVYQRALSALEINDLRAGPYGGPGILAPRNLAATGGPGLGEITLAWQPPVSDGGSPLTGYRVYRSTTIDGPYDPIAEVGTNPTYLDRGLGNGAARFYRVTAFNAAGEGPPSDTASATTFASPGAPTDFAAQGGPIPGEIVLTWRAPASDGGSALTGYRVYRGTAPGNETFPADVDERTYTDTNLTPGRRYYYQVQAVNLVGGGAFAQAAGRATLTTPALDADADLLPDAAEAEACGRQATRDAINGLPPGTARCVSSSDAVSPHPVDAYASRDLDDDHLLDAIEPVICALENQNDPSDGTCVGSDYQPPV